MLRNALVPAAVFLLLAGCNSQLGAPKPPPPEAHEPTAAEIQSAFNAVLQPVYATVANANADTQVAPALASQVQSQLEEQKKKFSSHTAYGEGVRGVVMKLEDDLRVVRDKQNGVLALYLCSLIRNFDPDNSRVVRFEKWGETVKNRPIVKIRGWYQPLDTPQETIYAFLEVYTPEDGQTHHVQVREGEEFLGLKYEKMIGKKQGIQFQYLKTGDKFVVYSTSWLRQR